MIATNVHCSASRYRNFPAFALNQKLLKPRLGKELGWGHSSTFKVEALYPVMSSLMMQNGFPIALQRAANGNVACVRPRRNTGRSLKRLAGNNSVRRLVLSASLSIYGVVAFSAFVWIALNDIDFLRTRADAVMASLDPTSFAINNKDDFIRHLDAQRAREVAAQSSYVADIIRRTSSLSNQDARRLAEEIVFESRNANLDPLFVAAVIKTESTFKRQAVSSVGATGLMQLMPDTGRYVSERLALDWNEINSLTDPVSNIKLGVAYLKELQESFSGNTERALIAYNWGPANLNRALKEGSQIPESTVKYARNVMRDHKKWQEEFAERAAEFWYVSAGDSIG